MKNSTQIKVEEIKSVYSGIDGKCCCGCAGKHYYASASRVAASKHRGYDIEDDEINDKMVARVVRLINKATDVDVEATYVATVVGRRLYIAYLN